MTLSSVNNCNSMTLEKLIVQAFLNPPCVSPLRDELQACHVILKSKQPGAVSKRLYRHATGGKWEFKGMHTTGEAFCRGDLGM